MPIENYGRVMQGAADFALTPYNTLMDARREQKTNKLLDLRAQSMQREMDDEDEWDAAIKAGDFDTAMRIDPHATTIMQEHERQKRASIFTDIPISAKRIDEGAIQDQTNKDREFAANEAYRKANLGLQYAQERRLAAPQPADDEFARYQAMTPEQRDLYDRMRGRGSTKERVLQAANQRAFDVYQAGIDGLKPSFDGVTTGPIAGILPAMSAGAQKADNAVAAMAPILKQLFRAAGEGVFTDKDQELLLAMIPTRKMLPEARDAAFANIDAIVRAKLGIPQAQEEPVIDLPSPGGR